MDRSRSYRGWSWWLAPAVALLAWSALGLEYTSFLGVSLRGERVQAVLPGGPAEHAGLRVGDGIAELAPGRRTVLSGLDPIGDARIGVPVTLTRIRGGELARVWLAPEPLPPGERRLRAALLAMAAGFVLLGRWVWSERRDRLTRVFWMLCLTFAALLLPDPPLGSHAARVAWDVCYTAVQLLLPALFLHFFTLFPEPDAARHSGWLIKSAYALALGLFLVQLLPSALTGHAARAAAAQDLSVTLATVWFAGGLLLGLAQFVRAFARRPEPDTRRRLRVALLGTLFGVMPLVALVAWRNFAPGAPAPAERWSVLATLLVPASFAWAITVHRVFDFRVALRAATLLAAGALVAIALFVLGEWLAALAWPALGSSVTGVAFAALSLAAPFVDPARRAIVRLGTRVVPIADERSLAAWTPPGELAREGAPEEILRAACGALVRTLRLDGCAAVRVRPGPPVVVAHAGSRHMPPLSESFAGTASRTVGPQRPADLDHHGEDRDALELAGIHWTLAVPGTAAVLLLGRRLTGAWLDRQESADLERFADHLAVGLENAELRGEARARGVLNRELEVAHDIQVRRLPRRAPAFATLDCAAASLSTEAVGGDCYDFLLDGPRSFTLVVGDAAGHGVPAALVLADVQARFRETARRARGPAEVLATLNLQLCAHDQPEKFIGLLCAQVDVSAGQLRFANGGLTPPLVRRADGRYEELDRSGGLLLGVDAGARYEAATLELDAGDLVVLCTDGLTEASRGGRMFGTEGIRRIVERHHDRRAVDLVDELLQAVRRWTDGPLDDLTVVVLKQLVSPGPRGRGVRSGLKLEPGTADALG